MRPKQTKDGTCMKKLSLALFIFILILGVSGLSLSQEERDGSSMEKAVIITYSGNYQESLGQEYQYIAKKYGTQNVDYEILEQRLVDDWEGTPYDVITIRLIPSGEEKEVYFDITALQAAWKEKF